MNVVLVWAWWTWMSGIAWILHNLWYWEEIICLDSTESELTKKLKEFWLKVIIWENKYIPKITDHIIYSEACVNSSEVIQAKSYKRKAKEQRFIWNYFDFLWEISKYFTTIGITGTNGKSTTSAMLLTTAKNHLDKLWIGILWALVPELDNNNYYINPNIKTEIKNIFDYIFTWKWLNYSLIKKNFFILEACEYKRHFLKIDLDRWAITNIELDHTDYYKNLDDYNSAFQSFVDKTKNKVFTTSNLDIKSIEQIKTNNFDFKYLLAKHNQENWTLVFELIKQLNSKVNTRKLKKTIENFKWLRRRLELLETTKNGSLLFSDYGHMASSINLWYHAVKEKYPNKKITAIFQPHQINRILREWNEFSKALRLFDNVFIYDIYAAREDLVEQLENFKHLKIKNINKISELWDIFAKNCNWKYTENIEEIKKTINNGNKSDVFIVFSAWNIDFLLRNKKA